MFYADKPAFSKTWWFVIRTRPLLVDFPSLTTNDALPMTTSRTDTETSTSLSGSTDVLAAANGPTDRQDHTAADHCNVIRKEQASSGILVQHSEEQVRINQRNLRADFNYRFDVRVDELYRFLNSWVAHIYGDLDEEALKVRGFELIQHDTEWANNRTSSKVNIWTIAINSLL